MMLYPTNIIFRDARAMERAVADLRARRPMPESEATKKHEFEKLVGIEYWRTVESEYKP